MIAGAHDSCRAAAALSSSQRKSTRAWLSMSAIQRSSLSLASASITGPTCVAGSRGSPSASSRAAPAIISSMRSATSSCTQSSRNAEQRWPAERNAEVITSSVTCSGSAVASTIMALMPPVSAISGTIGPSLAASVRLMTAGDLGRAGEGDAGNTRHRPISMAPTLPSPGTRCSALAGTPASCSSRTASEAMSGVCSAGLATTVLPAASARRDLADENRQREIPRADADEHAAAAIAQLVALAGRARHRLRYQRAARFGAA